MNKSTEIAFSVNPHDVTKEKAAAWKRCKRTGYIVQ